MTDRNGRPVYFETYYSPHRDTEGNIIGTMGIALEITDRILAEQALEKYQENLEEMVTVRTEELAAANTRLTELSRVKDEFVSNVSHELRTPLTSIILRHELIRLNPETLPHHLDVLDRESDRLLFLIEDLLRLTQLDQKGISLQLTSLDLNQVLTTYLSDREAIFNDKDQTIFLEETNGIVKVMADPNQFEQMLASILNNATRYTPSGGKITVSVMQLAKDGVALAGFMVEDSGPGIDDQDLPHIFERFYRGSVGKESRTAGTGLGLSIARQIVELHNGTIEVINRDAPESGTRVTVLLPEASI